MCQCNMSGSSEVVTVHVCNTVRIIMYEFKSTSLAAWTAVQPELR